VPRGGLAGPLPRDGGQGSRGHAGTRARRCRGFLSFLRGIVALRAAGGHATRPARAGASPGCRQSCYRPAAAGPRATAPPADLRGTQDWCWCPTLAVGLLRSAGCMHACMADETLSACHVRMLHVAAETERRASFVLLTFSRYALVRTTVMI
jgi:hypothetical protein